jgi:hypothetical protein
VRANVAIHRGQVLARNKNNFQFPRAAGPLEFDFSFSRLFKLRETMEDLYDLPDEILHVICTKVWEKRGEWGQREKQTDNSVFPLVCRKFHRAIRTWHDQFMVPVSEIMSPGDILATLARTFPNFRRLVIKFAGDRTIDYQALLSKIVRSGLSRLEELCAMQMPNSCVRALSTCINAGPLHNLAKFSVGLSPDGSEPLMQVRDIFPCLFMRSLSKLCVYFDETAYTSWSGKRFTLVDLPESLEILELCSTKLSDNASFRGSNLQSLSLTGHPDELCSFSNLKPNPENFSSLTICGTDRWWNYDLPGVVKLVRGLSKHASMVNLHIYSIDGFIKLFDADSLTKCQELYMSSQVATQFFEEGQAGIANQVRLMHLKSSIGSAGMNELEILEERGMLPQLRNLRIDFDVHTLVIHHKKLECMSLLDTGVTRRLEIVAPNLCPEKCWLPPH